MLAGIIRILEVRIASISRPSMGLSPSDSSRVLALLIVVQILRRPLPVLAFLFLFKSCIEELCSMTDGSRPSTTTSNPATTSPAPSSHSEDNQNLIKALASAIPTVFVIGIALAVYCWCKRRAPRRNREIVDLDGSDLGHEPDLSQVPTIEPYTTPPTMNERNRLAHAKHRQNGGFRDSGRGSQDVSPAPEERFQRLEELLRSTTGSRPQFQDYPGDTNTAALRDEHPPAYASNSS